MKMLRDPTVSAMEDRLLEQLIGELSRKHLTISQRKNLATFYIEEYLKERGKTPNADQLQCLSDFILVEELKSTSPDKVANTEYPFLSNRQLKRRSGRERSFETTNIEWFYHVRKSNKAKVGRLSKSQKG